MRYSVNVPNFGEFAAPGVFAEVARRAEEAGWDALLVGDSVAGEKDLRWEIADPWILLTAAALATSRIRLGTAITPVAYRGNQITIDDVVFLPVPVQRPRVPIWVGGFWPRKTPMRRAARWDGAIPLMAGWESGAPPGLGEVAELVGFLRGCRAGNGLAGRPFDIVIGGTSPAGPAAGRDLAGPLADLGITWWGDDMGRADPAPDRAKDRPGSSRAPLTGVA